MQKNYYTNDEILFCTYAARYDASDFGGAEMIGSLTGRLVSSILMKIRNIASTLDAKGVARFSSVAGLTGRTTGVGARETNWDIIEPLTLLSRHDLLQCCLGIMKKQLESYRETT